MLPHVNSLVYLNEVICWCLLKCRFYHQLVSGVCRNSLFYLTVVGSRTLENSTCEASQMDQAHYQQKLVLIEYQTQASLEELQNQSLFVWHVPVSEQMTIKRTSGHTQNAAPSDLNNKRAGV